jgi:hypothetical protein
MIDWNVIITASAASLAVILSWVLITLLKQELRERKLNKQVQKLLDGSDQ